MNDLQIMLNAWDALDKKFGMDIVLLDISGKTSMADYFLIATGNTQIQMQAMAAAVEESLERDGLKMHHGEGLRSSGWMLLDFGDVIVHLFDKEARAFYNLERVWGDAKVIER